MSYRSVCLCIGSFYGLRSHVSISSYDDYRVVYQTDLTPTIGGLSYSTYRTYSRIYVARKGSQSLLICTLDCGRFRISIFVLDSHGMNRQAYMQVRLYRVSTTYFTVTAFVSPSATRTMPYLVDVRGTKVDVLSEAPTLPYTGPSW